MKNFVKDGAFVAQSDSWNVGKDKLKELRVRRCW